MDPKKLIKGIDLFKRAQAFHAERAWQQAADTYRQALALVPDHPEMLVAYGRLAEDVGDWPGAEQIYRRLLAVKPVENLDGKIGHLLFKQDRYEEAIPFLEAFSRRQPDDGVMLSHIAMCYFKTLRFERGLALAKQAWAKARLPDVMSLLLAYYVELGDGMALAPLVEEALSLFPDDPQVRSLAAEHLLKAGDYDRGFVLLPNLRNKPGQPRHYLEDVAVDWWDGKPFDGTVLIGGEQGIGDEILAASMYRDLVALDQRVVIEADARLLPALRRSFPTLEFIARNEFTLETIAAKDPAAVRKFLSGDLGGMFRTDRSRFAAHANGWLQPDPDKTEDFRARYRRQWPDRALAGLAWKSQRALKGGISKAIPVTSFAPLLRQGSTAFVSLQYGDIAEDLASLGPDARNLYVDPDVDTFNDIDAVFAQVASLDFVITTSNVAAHIAGSMGKPCQVILPRNRPVIWYWGYTGDSTPWYPSIRLYRNGEDDGNWTALIARIADDLQ